MIRVVRDVYKAIILLNRKNASYFLNSVEQLIIMGNVVDAIMDTI